MRCSQRYNLVSNILQTIDDIGIRMGNETHLHWLAKTATCCFIITYTLQIIYYAVNVRQEFYNSFDSVRDLAFLGVGILKLISLRKNCDIWHFLLNEATNIEKEQLELQLKCEFNNGNNAFEFSEYIRVYREKFQIIFTTLPKLYKITLIVYILNPFVEYGFNKYIGNQTDVWPHILACWSPLEKYSFAGYILIILLEVVASIYCVYIHIAFDMTSIGIMMFITEQFILLRNYSENIGSKEDVSTSKTRDDLAHSRIKLCHNFHVRLTNSTAELRALLKNILGVYFCIATLQLCAIVVTLNSEIKILELIAMLQYLFATLIQLFLFCYYGDNIVNESTVGQGEGPYGTAYWSLSPRIRKELVILAMGMSRPCQLYAGPFISVNLPSFIQVLRTAYSYYAFIRSRKE